VACRAADALCIERNSARHTKAIGLFLPTARECDKAYRLMGVGERLVSQSWVGEIYTITLQSTECVRHYGAHPRSKENSLGQDDPNECLVHLTCTSGER